MISGSVGDDKRHGGDVVGIYCTTSGFGGVGGSGLVGVGGLKRWGGRGCVYRGGIRRMVVCGAGLVLVEVEADDGGVASPWAGGGAEKTQSEWNVSFHGGPQVVASEDGVVENWEFAQRRLIFLDQRGICFTTVGVGESNKNIRF